MKKYDEYGIEQGTLNLTPYIVLGLVIFFVLIGIVIFIFNLGNITKHFVPNDKDKTQEQTKTEEEVKEVEGLIVPTVEYGTIFNDRDYEIKLEKIEATSKGYTLYIDIKATEKAFPGQVDCYRILIDGYDIEGEFNININPGETKQEKIVLRKTDLEHLEINNFKNLTFCMKIYGGPEDIPVYGITAMKTPIPVDNEKKGITDIYDKNDIVLSYYKKMEDNDFTYLYFQAKNDTVDVYNIKLNKLTIDNKIYEDTYNIKSYPSGKQISYLKIPKDKVKKVGKIKISFFLEKESSIENYNVYISAEKEIKT